MRHFRPSLNAHGLTEQQWRVLRALDGVEAVGVTRLAEATFLLAPSLTRILHDMESRRLILRRPDPGDRRASLIALSERGRRTLREVGAESEAIYAAIEARLGKARLEALMTLLAEAEAQLGEAAAEPIDGGGKTLNMLGNATE